MPKANRFVLKGRGLKKEPKRGAESGVKKKRDGGDKSPADKVQIAEESVGAQGQRS